MHSVTDAPQESTTEAVTTEEITAMLETFDPDPCWMRAFDCSSASQLQSEVNKFVRRVNESDGAIESVSGQAYGDGPHFFGVVGYRAKEEVQ